MINLLLFLIAVACLSIAAAWVAENPGAVVIHWFDYRIDTSFAFLLLTFILAALLLAAVIVVIRRIVVAPKHFMEKRSLKHYKRGLTELTYSVAALAAADTRSAEEHTKKAQKHLGDVPITLLLSAQIARSQGDDTKTRQLLEQLLEHKETAYLAARSLSDSASKQQQLSQALSMAEKAQELNPKDTGAVAATLSLHVKLGQWQEAFLAIQKTWRKSRGARSELKRYRGLVHLKHAMVLLEQSRPEEALANARAALKELGNFTPAVLAVAKSYDAAQQTEKGVRLLLSAWRASPNPIVADAFRDLIAKLPAKKRQKLMNAVDTTVTDGQPIGWTCRSCGHTTSEWDIHCQHCGTFDGLASK